MKRMALLCAVILSGINVVAQQQAAAAPDKNPVTSTIKQFVNRQKPNVVGASELMPADKYSYKPTEQQMTFGHLIEHIVKSNYFLCEQIGGSKPTQQDVKESDGKDKLVAALKASFDFCTAALDSTDDTKLADQVTMFGGRKAPKVAAMVALTVDFADHYAAQAMYLRLNNLTPPSAQRRQ
jgi:uncharacterized damage-inducible protein DinB